MKKIGLSYIGLFQALGVVIYSAIVGVLITSLDKIGAAPPKFLAITSVLSLVVLSVAIVGFLIFGYAAYLALKNKLSDAVYVILYTLLYLLALVMIVITLANLY